MRHTLFVAKGVRRRKMRDTRVSFNSSLTKRRTTLDARSRIACISKACHSWAILNIITLLRKTMSADKNLIMSGLIGCQSESFRKASAISRHASPPVHVPPTYNNNNTLLVHVLSCRFAALLRLRSCSRRLFLVVSSIEEEGDCVVPKKQTKNDRSGRTGSKSSGQKVAASVSTIAAAQPLFGCAPFKPL